MDITKIRSDFMIYVTDDEESIRDILREALTTAGYQVETFPTADEGLKHLKESPPHLVLSDIRMPGMTGIEFLAKTKELSRDIEFVIMTSHANLETAVEGMKLGAFDYIYKPFESLTAVVNTCDRAIERVYMKQENEQLLEELASKNKLLATVNQKIAQENKEIQLVNAFMQKLAHVTDPDAVIQQLIDAISGAGNNKPVLLFKYLASYSSLVVALASKIPIEGIRTLGVNLEKRNPNEILEALKEPQKIEDIRELMREVFKVTDPLILPFMYQGQSVGTIVSFDPLKGDSDQRILNSYMQIAAVSYDNAILTSRIKEMAIKDPLTGLYNRRYFNEKLEEEISRSRRTHYPVSLIYLDIDHFKKYNDTNGHPMGDVIIKSVAQILQKTSRRTDIVARLGGEEFAILCPHTAAVGAAVKAEKIRLTVETTKFPNGEKQPLGRVSVSLGVSEFPSFSSEPEVLIRSADDALYKVKQGGRNRVCMAEAPAGFKPEFEPIPVPRGDIKPGTGGSAA